MQRTADQFRIRELSWRGYIHIHPSIRIQNVLMVIPYTEQQLNHINKRRAKTRDYNVHIDRIVQRLQQRRYLRLRIHRQNISKLARGVHFQHQINNQQQELDKQLHKQVRLAYDQSGQVVQQNERYDIRVDELLRVAEVGAILVHILLEQILEIRNGLSVGLEQRPCISYLVVYFSDNSTRIGGLFAFSFTTTAALLARAQLARFLDVISSSRLENQNRKLSDHIQRDQTQHGVENELLVHDIAVER